MSVAFPFTLEQLVAVFPLDEIPAELTDSYGDAVTETEPFRGLKWTEVPSQLLRYNFEAPSAFSPRAYHYYFPTLIWLTNTNCDDATTAADYAINLLHNTDNEGWLHFRQKRWSLFNREQWIIVKEWLSWLKATPDTVSDEGLDGALETVHYYLRLRNGGAPLA